MKSWNHLYETAISEKTRRAAVHKVCLGRKKMKNLERYAADEKATAEKALKWITEYRNARHHPVLIHDGINRKKRTIIVPTFEELTVQHCVVMAMMPVFRHGMYEHSYASIPGRGAHKAKKVIERWITHDTKGVKYVLKMDVRHFFDSVPHDRLKEKIAAKVHDARMVELLNKIVDVTEAGLPLGFYTSQWFSNWYLEGLDHFIKEELHANHYVRYMDDMVVFGSNKKELHRMRAEIDGYLRRELGLELKGNWQVFRFDHLRKGRHYGRDLDFMGFRFFRDRTVLRRSIMLKATRKAKALSKKEKPTIYDIRQMLSYLGWIDATDTYAMYEERIKPYVSIQKFKRRISSYDRNRQKQAARVAEGGKNEHSLHASRRVSGNETGNDGQHIEPGGSLPEKERGEDHQRGSADRGRGGAVELR